MEIFLDWMRQIPYLSIIFQKNWLFVPIFGLVVFFSVYFWADKLFVKLYDKSLGKQNDIMRYMKLLGMEVNEKKVTAMLLSVSFGLGFLFFLLAWPNIGVGLVMGVSFGIMGFQLPPLIFKALYEKRCNAFVDQMVDALTILANGVKA
ncbi:MAG: hypothetical protein K2P92_02855, partial [Bdellovibrionaceae bacterium]|nr:hypothetical protein [Pseudobdellovibrionaceae bacterium]